MKLLYKGIGLTGIIAIILSGNVAKAQIDRSQPPEPGPEPKIQFGKPESFTLANGLKVFVVEDHSIPKVSYQLSLENDPVLEEEAVGYVSIAGNMLRRGTENKSKPEIDQAIDFIGADLNTSSSGMYGSSLTKHSRELLTIMQDVLLNPSFPEEELEKVKKQVISRISASEADPNDIASNVRKVLTFGKNHPYGELETKQTVEEVSVEKCRQYYENYFRPNNAYLVVVGDITVSKAKKNAKQYFGAWEKKAVPEHEYDKPKPPEEPRVALVNRDGSVQSVIMLSYPVQLKPGSDDHIQADIMNSMLGGRAFSSMLMQNIREDKGYSYGAYSRLNADQYIGSFYATSRVRNEVTDSTISQILKEMKAIRQGAVDQEKLEIIKNMKSGDFARSLENPRTIARFALNIERYDLPADYYQNYLKNLSNVSAKGIKKAAKRYIKPENVNIIVVGSAGDVENKIQKFGPVSRYDKYGNKIERKKPASGGGAEVPVNKVFENYYEAVGGREKIAQVNNLIIKSSFEVQGRQLQNTTIHKLPDKYLNETAMNSRVLSKQIYNDGKGVVKAQGQERVVEGDMLQRMKYSVYPFRELQYEEMGFQTENMGVENVNGEEAYKIKITSPEGLVTYDFFDKDSGLKVKTVKKGGATIVYEDYQQVNGIQFPHQLDTQTPRGNFTATVTEIRVNPDIANERFSLD